jgi:hypothetical protein
VQRVGVKARAQTRTTIDESGSPDVWEAETFWVCEEEGEDLVLVGVEPGFDGCEVGNDSSAVEEGLYVRIMLVVGCELWGWAYVRMLERMGGLVRGWWEEGLHVLVWQKWITPSSPLNKES